MSAPTLLRKRIKKQEEGLPGMYWLNMPERWSIKEDEHGNKLVKVTCREEVDFWRHTLHGFVKDDAPFYWKFVYGDFEARLTIKGKFHYLYDMAGIMIRQNEDQWMTCGISNFQDNLQSRYHKHQAKHLYISSTFTRGKSDWSTHRALQKKRQKSSLFHVWVRRIGNLVECFYSLDNDLWIKVREGVLAPGVRKLRVGMMCTAPESAGFTVIFSDFMILGGDKMPEDDRENLVYKTNGAHFLGMLEKEEVDRRTQEDKERMLTRVERERAKANPGTQIPVSSRSLQTESSIARPNDHLTHKDTAAVLPTRRPSISLPVKSKRQTKNDSQVATQEWKPGPTNPYAHEVTTTKEGAPNPLPQLQASEDLSLDEKQTPPPRKLPKTNPYAVVPPTPNNIAKATTLSARKKSTRGPSRKSSLSTSKGSGQPRNGLTREPLDGSTVTESTRRLQSRLGNPNGRQSDMEKSHSSNHTTLPSRKALDNGYHEDFHHSPEPSLSASDGIIQRRKSCGSNDDNKEKPSECQSLLRSRSRRQSRNPRQSNEELHSKARHTRLQQRTTDEPEQPQKPSIRSKAKVRQRRSSKDGKGISLEENGPTILASVIVEADQIKQEKTKERKKKKEKKGMKRKRKKKLIA